jgi:hypothetical protein
MVFVSLFLVLYFMETILSLVLLFLLLRRSVDEWLYNGGPYELIVLHFLLGGLPEAAAVEYPVCPE